MRTLLSFASPSMLLFALAACGTVQHQDAPDAAGGPSTDAAPTDAAPPPVCTAGAALRCDGNSLVSCNADGSGEVTEVCGLRCDATSLACNGRIDPSNGLAAALDAATGEPAVTIASNMSISTDNFDASTGLIPIGSQQVKASLVPGANGAPDIVVLSVGSLTISAGAKLIVFGEKPSAFASAGPIEIDGTLEIVSGFAVTAEACFGATSGATGADNDVPGGGGAGFGLSGAQGGTVIGVGAGKSGGGSIGAATLIPLRGGCSGGTDALGAGGRGGGASQLVSATKIRIDGAIGANGTGGAVSAGGGSGGAILLEAPVVELPGGVFANGGGGGCGGFSSGANGANTLAPAQGASCVSNPNGTTGGNGGAGTTAPTQGGSVTNRAGQVDRAGGGGGAVGRIRINTLDAVLAVGPGTQSPPASLGLVGGRP